ncbi:MAG: GumC family protein, partial [Methylocella sp.]
MQIFRRDPIVMQVQGVMDNEIRGAEDLNTQIKVLESVAIVQRVAERLTGEDLRQFTAPYRKEGDSDPVSPAEIIFKNRRVVPARMSLIIQAVYQHPDRFVAAKVANLFLDEYIANNSRQRIEESMKAVDDLKVRAEQQKKKVEEIAVNLQAYREKNNLVSLDQRKDIVTEKLKALNSLVTQASSRRKDTEIKWMQVQERRGKPAEMLELPYITGQPLIGQLIQQMAAQKIIIAQLRDHYRAKHPKMIEAENSLAQTEKELNQSIDTTASMFEADYQNAKRTDEEAHSALKQQEAESLDLDRYAVEYANLEREFRISEHLLDTILARMKETSMTSTIETQNARVVDRAAPALKPVSPNNTLNISIGILGGLVLGTVFAFFVAFVDDRVKSSFDIESVVGLPLIGI